MILCILQRIPTTPDVIHQEQNKQKHKFWFDKTQLNKIENKVNLYKNAKLNLKQADNKLVSFEIIDDTDDHIVFTGHFI